jgi:hypothetical protein
VQALIGERKLVAPRTAASILPDRIDLTGIPTEQLRGELARRGVTLDALDGRRCSWNEGRACAANHCYDRVGRGT